MKAKEENQDKKQENSDIHVEYSELSKILKRGGVYNVELVLIIVWIGFEWMVMWISSK